jgi:polyphosphate kinase 2 (PPK2 family)
MNYRKKFAGTHEMKKSALPKIENLHQRMDSLQFQLYAEQKRSLLICLQAPDAGGKDGIVRHVIGSMNPQGCPAGHFQSSDFPGRVFSFHAMSSYDFKQHHAALFALGA